MGYLTIAPSLDDPRCPQPINIGDFCRAGTLRLDVTATSSRVIVQCGK